VKTVYGRRIRQARRMRRYSMSLVAKNAGVRQPWLSELERSYTADISEEALIQLAKALEFPPRFFSVEPQDALHFGSLLFRGKSSLTDTDADYLAEYAGATGQIFQGLSERASSPPVRLPDLPSEASPAEAAGIVRQQFSIKAEEPIDSLVRKAERSGVLVMLLDFDIRLHDRLDAFSCWVGTFTERPVVVLRSGASWDRLRWSMAHELGHAVLHRRLREGDIEAAANNFANELLLPRDALTREWPRNPTIMSLLPLKEKWGLSIQALMEHGFRAGLLDEARRISLYKQLSNRKWPDGTRWREREPGYNSRDVEQPRLLGKMVEVGLGVGTSLDVVSDATGYWPVLLLQQLLGIQLARPADTSRRKAVIVLEGQTESRIVSLSDWRREESEGPATGGNSTTGTRCGGDLVS
jgi:Zn-dependent peptidase ImmA (M78 family)